jgi:hypothetical protein
MKPRLPLLVGLCALLLCGACRKGDPKKDLRVSDVETYWVVETPKGQTQAIAPAIRLTLENVSGGPLDSIYAAAGFRRDGEEWGGDWQQVASRKKPLAPGKTLVVVLRSGEGRYTSTGDPEGMLRVEAFRDPVATVHLRVGTSPWIQVTSATIERRIGSRAVQDMR